MKIIRSSIAALIIAAALITASCTNNRINPNQSGSENISSISGTDNTESQEQSKGKTEITAPVIAEEKEINGYRFKIIPKTDLSAKINDIKNLYYSLYNKKIPMLFVIMPEKSVSFHIENDMTEENLIPVRKFLNDEFIDTLDLSHIFDNEPEKYYYKNRYTINADGYLEITRKITELMPAYYSILINGSAASENGYYTENVIQDSISGENYIYYTPPPNTIYRMRSYGSEGNKPTNEGVYNEIIFNAENSDNGDPASAVMDHTQIFTTLTNIETNKTTKDASVMIVHNLEDMSLLPMMADNFERIISYDVRNMTTETLISNINDSGSPKVCIVLLDLHGEFPPFMKGGSITNNIYNMDHTDMPVKDNNRILQVINVQADVSQYIKNFIELRDFLKGQNTELLFVQAPFKVLEGITKLPAGIIDYSNENADNFLKGLNENGINYLDLRDYIQSESGLGVGEMFFKTDHHWKPQTAFWAHGKVLEYINKNFGWDLNPGGKFTDKNNFVFESRPHYYLSHLGQKYNSSFVGIDEFTLIYPDFKTSFTRTNDLNGEITSYKGNYYEAFFNQIYFQSDDPAEYNRYAAYMDGDRPLIKVINHDPDASDIKVIVVKDSFANAFTPLFSLNFKELIIFDIRHYNLRTLTRYVTDYHFDLVIFLYNPNIYTHVPTMFKFK